MKNSDLIITPKTEGLDIRLLTIAGRAKLQGSTDIEILDMLREEGVSREVACGVLVKIYSDIEGGAESFDILRECFFGIMRANDIQREAAASGDLKHRVEAEKIRYKWVEKLHKIKVERKM